MNLSTNIHVHVSQLEHKPASAAVKGMNTEHSTSNAQHPMEQGGEGGLFGESPKRTGESPVPPMANAATGRLSVQTVERLHRLLGGDAHVEGMVLHFIADKYSAKSLFHLPPHVAKGILNRPADFLRAVKEHCEPELPF